MSKGFLLQKEQILPRAMGLFATVVAGSVLSAMGVCGSSRSSKTSPAESVVGVFITKLTCETVLTCLSVIPAPVTASLVSPVDAGVIRGGCPATAGPRTAAGRMQGAGAPGCRRGWFVDGSGAATGESFLLSRSRSRFVIHSWAPSVP